jgi:hypothetical protein
MCEVETLKWAVYLLSLVIVMMGWLFWNSQWHLDQLKKQLRQLLEQQHPQSNEKKKLPQRPEKEAKICRQR